MFNPKPHQRETPGALVREAIQEACWQINLQKRKADSCLPGAEVLGETRSTANWYGVPFGAMKMF